MIISIGTKEVFDNIRCIFLPSNIQSLSKIGTEERFLNLMSDIQPKPTADVICGGKVLRHFC